MDQGLNYATALQNHLFSAPLLLKMFTSEENMTGAPPYSALLCSDVQGTAAYMISTTPQAVQAIESRQKRILDALRRFTNRAQAVDGFLPREFTHISEFSLFVNCFV